MTQTARPARALARGRAVCAAALLAAACAVPEATAADAARAACPTGPDDVYSYTVVSREPFGRAALVRDPAGGPPAGFVPTPSTFGVRRIRGSDGRAAWSTPDDEGSDFAVLPGRSGSSLVTVAPVVCGAVVLTARDAATGVRRWSRVHPGQGGADLPDAHFVLPGAGDFNGDGWADAAVLETSADDGAEVAGTRYAVLVGHPSGQATFPAAAWRSAYFVVDGRTGRLLRDEALGGGTGTPPMLLWIGRRLLVAVPSGPAATRLTLVGAGGPVWQREVGAALADVDLRAVGARVAVLRSASYGEQTAAGQLDVLDAATGATAWSLPVAGSAQLAVGGRGEVYVTDRSPGRLLRLDAATGAPAWVVPVPDARDGAVVLDDFDGDGRGEAGVVGVLGTVVVSSRDGATLAALPAGERPHRVGDATGDGRADLLTAAADGGGTATLRLRRGLATPLWTAAVRGCGEVSRVHSAAGSLLVEGPGCAYAALDARTGRTRWRVEA